MFFLYIKQIRISILQAKYMEKHLQFRSLQKACSKIGINVCDKTIVFNGIGCVGSGIIRPNIKTITKSLS